MNTAQNTPLKILCVFPFNAHEINMLELKKTFGQGWHEPYRAVMKTDDGRH